MRPINLCELCGIDAGARYASDERCNAFGRGVVLHVRCAAVVARMDDDTFVAVLDATANVQRGRARLARAAAAEAELDTGLGSEALERALEGGAPGELTPKARLMLEHAVAFVEAEPAAPAKRLGRRTPRPAVGVGIEVEGDANICDGCGEVARDIDTGFSPAVHGMAHDCGGTWRRGAA